MLVGAAVVLAAAGVPVGDAVLVGVADDASAFGFVGGGLGLATPLAGRAVAVGFAVGVGVGVGGGATA